MGERKKEGKDELVCDLCGGTGEVEEAEYECNDSTGFNTVVMGTGVMKPCPECRDEEDSNE